MILQAAQSNAFFGSINLVLSLSLRPPGTTLTLFFAASIAHGDYTANGSDNMFKLRVHNLRMSTLTENKLKKLALLRLLGVFRPDVHILKTIVLLARQNLITLHFQVASVGDVANHMKSCSLEVVDLDLLHAGMHISLTNPHRQTPDMSAIEGRCIGV